MHTQIPSNWCNPERFEQTFVLGNYESLLVGLSCTSKSGLTAIGSAAGPAASNPSARAQYELLERIAVLEAPNRSEPVRIYDHDGNALGSRSFNEIIGDDRDNNLARAARSNGVAFHATFETACHQAYLELTERDRCMRSWFSGTRPERTNIPSNSRCKITLDQLSPWYRFELYTLPKNESVDSNVTVAVFLGFPLDEQNPIVYGFGAHSIAITAYEKAIDECLQRLGFLWGEPLPETDPEFSPTPNYHQEFYLYAKNVTLLRRWLDGKNSLVKCNLQPLLRTTVMFADITPASMNAQGFVVKAFSNSALPLFFGRADTSVYTNIFENISPERNIHPMC